MRNGKMHKFGEIVLANVQYTDTFEIKKRPALVLFEEQGNIVVAGVTSNTNMNGVKIYKKEGALKDSVIKLNYIFTISEKMIEKNLFIISPEKKKLVKEELNKRIG
jgi:mRNA interferase MazF